MKQLLLPLLLIYFFAAHYACAESLPSLMHQRQIDSVLYFDKKTKAKRSEVTCTLQKNAGDRANTYTLAIQGKGDYDKFTNITWDIRAYMEEKNSLLYNQHVRCIAKDIQGKPFIYFEKEFDYRAKRIFWRQRNAMGKITKEAAFPLKGITTDDVTLVYFLKTLVATPQKTRLESFYLLTNEPRLYKIKVKFLDTETLTRPDGKKQTLKLKLNPDIGLLDNVFEKYLPHTYVWLEASFPYDWVQYEGLETGLYSRAVTALVQHRDLQ